jgi:hypothetical protein
LVKKSDGSWRPCVDYRRLNELTVRNNYPLPVIDDILASVGSGKVFTRIDLYSAFWQVPVKETDIPKTAFTCPMGLYEFVFMPFGLKNAPATFQCVINHVLAPVLGKFCVAYLDDVIIYSENEQEHAEHVKIVLDLLINAGLRIKIDKCDFGVTEMELLGFKVSDQGISPITERCVAIRDLSVEKSIKGIQSFMGLVRYYQRFVPRLAELSQPLTKLLRKENSISEWGPEQDQAVVKIKSSFLEPPLLSHFDPSLPTLLHTDASNYAVGAVLSQLHDGVERPVCYASKTLDRAQTNYTVTEKECLAVVWATELFRTLLLGTPFTLETDHSALKQILTTKDSAGRLARWALKLQEYDMEVLYRKGTCQGNADFFSRIIDLGDGTHAVRLVVDEQEYTDREFCLEHPTHNLETKCYVNAEVVRIDR